VVRLLCGVLMSDATDNRFYREPAASVSLIDKLRKLPHRQDYGDQPYLAYVALSDVIEIVHQHAAAPEAKLNKPPETLLSDDVSKGNLPSEISVVEELLPDWFEPFCKWYKKKFGFEYPGIADEDIALEQCWQAAVATREPVSVSLEREALRKIRDKAQADKNADHQEILDEIEQIASYAILRHHVD